MKPLELAKAIAVRAGDFLKRKQAGPRSITFKDAGKGNLVTDMDHASEDMIVKALKREFPDHAVVAEERGKVGTSDYRWYIDPIDGTTNYAHGFPIWTVTLALEVRGRLEVGVTYAPCLGELFWAERGKGAFRNGKRIRVTACPTVEGALLCTGFSYQLEVRRLNLKYFAEFLMRAQAIRRVGAASLDLCWTAAGAFDGFWEMRLGPWDMAAGIVILEEAGAKVTNFEGGAVDVFHGDFLGANPVLHRKMIQVMKRVKVDWMIDRLCKLLDDGDAELQIAVARVLRELKPKDAAVRKSLGGALKSQNEMVRLYALEALAAIDVQAALPLVIPLLTASENVRARATQIVLGAGAAAAAALTGAVDAKDPQVRKAALDLLSKLPGVDISDTLFAALLDTDVEVIRKAAAAYRQKIGTMAPAEKGKALKKVLEFLASSKVQKAKASVPSCLHLAGAFREASAAKDVVRYADKKQPSEVRAAALLALGEMPLEGKDARDVAAKLMPLLEEEDFHRIVKPALDVLWKIPPSPKDAPRLMKLQKSGGPAVRAFAVKALGSVGNVDAGEALLESLWSDDPRLSETASGAFRSNPDYVPMLAKALDKQEDMQKAFKVVHLLTQFKNVLDKGLVKKFMAKALSMLDRKESGFQAFFEVVRAAGPDLAKKEVLGKGRELLKKGKFEEAERALRLLQREDLAAPESDLALAAAQLRQQTLDLSGSARDQGHAIQLVQKLARKEGFPLLKQLEKEAAMFTPEGLLYLGFALVERQGDGRELGGDILKLVAKKFGGKDAGKIAKQKLKTQGVG